jgi:hypothetical protein
MHRATPIRAPVAAIIVLSAMALGGCFGATSPAIAPGTRACIGLPQATCEQAFQEADAQARGRGTVVVGIVVRCTGICTAASGEAERSLTYADGTSEQSSFGWQQAAPAPVGQPVGPEPSLAVAPTCLGVDVVTCKAHAIEALDDLDADPDEIVAIVVRCTTGRCTPARGEGETTITFADGRTNAVSWIYEGSP